MKYSLLIIIIFLFGCATKFTENDLRTSALMPEPVAYSILLKYKIPEAFVWNSPQFFCPKETVNIRETITVQYSASDKRLYLIARPFFCVYHAYVPNVSSANEAKEITLALKAIGAKITTYSIPNR
jgi:hypothetical protein